MDASLGITFDGAGKISTVGFSDFVLNVLTRVAKIGMSVGAGWYDELH